MRTGGGPALESSRTSAHGCAVGGGLTVTRNCWQPASGLPHSIHLRERRARWTPLPSREHPIGKRWRARAEDVSPSLLEPAAATSTRRFPLSFRTKRQIHLGRTCG